MSRYIDADALAYMVACNGNADFINKVTELMVKAPSIDVVTCGECIYRNNWKKCPMRVFTGDNDFCPCGADMRGNTKERASDGKQREYGADT